MAPRTGSAVKLVVLSALMTLFGCGLGIPSLVMSIVALARGARDGAGADRVLRAGWITFGVLAVLVVVFWVLWAECFTPRSTQPPTVDPVDPDDPSLKQKGRKLIRSGPNAKRPTPLLDSNRDFRHTGFK